MRKVILAEDDDNVRYALALYLRRCGFEVIEMADGIIGEFAHEFESADALVTDILMPQKDGIELLLEVRQRYPTLPVFAISGGGRISSENYLDSAAGLGATAVFEKPFDEARLVDAIEAATGSSAA